METSSIRQRFTTLSPFLNEHLRRIFVATEAMAIGYGGIAIVCRETGVNRHTIAAGYKELQHPEEIEERRVRKKGGGRKRAVDKDCTLKRDLENLVEPVTRGDPESPLRWSCKSVRRLSDELNQKGHQVSRELVAELLHGLGYSLQANKKTIEGASDPDRNAQFEHINNKVKEYQANGQPVISVDTKKKELVGNFKNGGRELSPKGHPQKVRVYDFIIPGLGKDTPYGVYDETYNVGWVNVGTDHDTAAFAVESIRQWWYSMGNQMYPKAKQLLITADSGGSNGCRSAARHRRAHRDREVPPRGGRDRAGAARERVRADHRRAAWSEEFGAVAGRRPAGQDTPIARFVAQATLTTSAEVPAGGERRDPDDAARGQGAGVSRRGDRGARGRALPALARRHAGGAGGGAPPLLRRDHPRQGQGVPVARLGAAPRGRLAAGVPVPFPGRRPARAGRAAGDAAVVELRARAATPAPRRARGRWSW